MASSASPPPPPVVCTLTTKDRAARELEWADLGALSLTAERLTDGVASTYPLEHEAAIRDLVDREASCCGTWLDGSVETDGEVVKLALTTTNPDGLAMILAMASLDR